MAPHIASEPLTIQRIEPQTDQVLKVSSPAFTAGSRIPDRYAEYGDGVSPPLEWTVSPRAKAFAVIVEDPDAPTREPFVHWAIWNIPGGTTSLPQDLPRTAHLNRPQGAIQGRNSTGAVGWFGPKPPSGSGPHHYHFQVFALSARLEAGPEIPFKDLLTALKPNVLAEGELVAVYERRAH